MRVLLILFLPLHINIKIHSKIGKTESTNLFHLH